jgi:rhamnose utilization protein RhaD (predicted bifunctional aldolase and dehydrogenase)
MNKEINKLVDLEKSINADYKLGDKIDDCDFKRKNEYHNIVQNIISSQYFLRGQLAITHMARIKFNELLSFTEPSKDDVIQENIAHFAVIKSRLPQSNSYQHYANINRLNEKNMSDFLAITKVLSP